jgi:cell filamentation protein
MFDPFKDFASAGYLRNAYEEKDARIIKRIEHEVFTRHLPKAIQYLASRRNIAYEDFLAVHRILFSEFYPWAGQDRSITAPNNSIHKGDTIFCHPAEIRLAINEGLRVAKADAVMASKPGFVMGMFAFAHPFLDGNGRTLLLLHLELAHRAGFSISWADTNKIDYLTALTDEINTPDRGVLDRYLLRFKGDRLERNEWGKSILFMKGLDGLDDDNQIDGDLTNPEVEERYRQFEKQRSYAYYQAQENNVVCNTCGATPCVCDKDESSTPSKPSGMGM